jgi:hypothetical protein
MPSGSPSPAPIKSHAKIKEGNNGRQKMKLEITLPSGATAKLKDPTLLRVKDRKKVMKAGDNETGDLAKALALGDAIIAMLIEEWSYDLIIPSVKIESLDELEVTDYDALVDATQEAQKVLFPSLNKTEGNETDPKAITENSKD